VRAVSHLHPGDTVIVENNTGCGVCEACKNGESRYCRNIWTFMNDQAGIGDYICVPEVSLQTYQGLTPAQACAAEPLTVAIDVTLRADIPLNAEVAIWEQALSGLWRARSPGCAVHGVYFSSAHRVTTRATVSGLRLPMGLAPM